MDEVRNSCQISQSVCLHVGLGGMLTITPRRFAGSLIGNAAVSTGGCRLQGRVSRNARDSRTGNLQRAVPQNAFRTQ